MLNISYRSVYPPMEYNMIQPWPLLNVPVKEALKNFMMISRTHADDRPGRWKERFMIHHLHTYNMDKLFSKNPFRFWAVSGKGLLVAVFVFALFSCSKKESHQESADLVEINESTEGMELQPEDQLPVAEDVPSAAKILAQTSPGKRGSDTKDADVSKGVRKLVKQGTIALQATEIDSAKLWIDHAVHSLGGYYEKEDLSDDESSSFYNIAIRVSPDKFEKLLAEVEKGNYKVLLKSIRITDISEEYVDVQSRITSKKAYLKRYRELLSRAASIKDMLELEEIIRSLQEEIESQESRLATLLQNSELSTLNVELKREKEPINTVETDVTFLEKGKKSLTSSIVSIEHFILWVLAVWPQIFVFGVILLFTWRKIRRYLVDEDKKKE